MTDSFMRLTKLEKPNQTLQDPHVLLKEVLARFADATNVRVECRFAEDVPKLLLDRDQFSTALANIVENAISAMPEGGTLTVRTSVAGGRRLAVSVSDTGRGIPERYLSKVFDSYFSLKDGGTGLGLVIVKKIVEDHGGRIKVESQEGTGTTFTLEFPVPEQRVA